MCRILPLLMLAAVPALAQYSTPFNSHEVNSNGSITFRYQNSGASKVTVDTDAAAEPLTMQKDSGGLWTVTTKALPAEYYSYTFVVDDVPQLDPLNNDVNANIVRSSSSVLVPGKPPAPWEITEIPHGNLTRHVLTTYIARGLPMNQEPYWVYTPPNYDAKRKYPVLYLLHGWSDYDDGWITVGRAQYILDSLISDGRAVPMIVVMPQSYGDYSFVTSPHDDVWKDPAKITGNLVLFSKMLTEEVIPAVDRQYPIAGGRENHGIAGLSMGGLESLTIGINHANYFGYVVGFSSALEHIDFSKQMIDPGFAHGLRMLWVACGTDDEYNASNHQFVAWAKSKGLGVTVTDTPGNHDWVVWRDSFTRVAPQLFRNGKR